MGKVKIYLAAVFILGQFVHFLEGSIHFGTCPNFPTVSDFNLAGVEGVWYEIKTHGFFIENIASRCNSVEFIHRSDSEVDLEYTRIFWPGLTNVNNGIAQLSEEGKLTMSITVPAFGSHIFPYWVLDTDYTKYLIGWSCTQLPLVNIRKVWVLSRERTLDNDTLKKVNESLRFYSIDPNQLKDIKQTECNSLTV